MTPDASCNVYFVEERVPANLIVTEVSESGSYVASKGIIRWPFLDNKARTLSYTVSATEGFTGTVTIAGEVTFDEEAITTSGDTKVTFGGGEIPAPKIQGAYFGGMMIEGIVGVTYVIEYSKDNVTWVVADEITLTVPAMYWADFSSNGQSKRFYRVKVK